MITYVQEYNTPGHRNTFLQRSGTIAETGNNEMAYTWPSPCYFPVEEINSKAVWTMYLNTDKVDFGNSAPTITITDLSTKKVYERNTLMSASTPSQKGYSWCNFRGKSISFSPPGISNLEGKSYKVSIGNLKDNTGHETTLEYTVHFSVIRPNSS